MVTTIIAGLIILAVTYWIWIPILALIWPIIMLVLFGIIPEDD